MTEQEAINKARELIPWRKGPFRLGGFTLDAEWRSDKKWDRIAPDLPTLKDKIIADVGCNNGYYLFRIAEAGARQIIGFDPTHKYKQQFDLVSEFMPKYPIEFRVEGWQALTDFKSTFDVIFLMGVNYHDPEPLNIFRVCKNALKPDGLLICESVVINSEQDLKIYPAGRYAGIGGVYAIPTTVSLCSDLSAAGFTNLRVQHVHQMGTDEQRPSEFSPQKSLADFQTEDGSSIEGYPPLYRAAVFARK